MKVRAHTNRRSLKYFLNDINERSRIFVGTMPAGMRQRYASKYDTNRQAFTNPRG